MRDLVRMLAAWPLLIMGLSVLGYSVTLAGDDPSDVRALVSGVGAVLVGAGIVTVSRGIYRDPPEPPAPTTEDTDA